MRCLCCSVEVLGLEPTLIGIDHIFSQGQILVRSTCFPKDTDQSYAKKDNAHVSIQVDLGADVGRVRSIFSLSE